MKENCQAAPTAPNKAPEAQPPKWNQPPRKIAPTDESLTVTPTINPSGVWIAADPPSAGTYRVQIDGKDDLDGTLVWVSWHPVSGWEVPMWRSWERVTAYWAYVVPAGKGHPFYGPQGGITPQDLLERDTSRSDLRLAGCIVPQTISGP